MKIQFVTPHSTTQTVTTQQQLVVGGLMPDELEEKPQVKLEDVDPAPWMGRVGDGAVLPSGEFISREIRELTERARQRRHADTANRQTPTIPAAR
jgi:hypothetical protein